MDTKSVEEYQPWKKVIQSGIKHGINLKTMAWVNLGIDSSGFILSLHWLWFWFVGGNWVITDAFDEGPSMQHWFGTNPDRTRYIRTGDFQH